MLTQVVSAQEPEMKVDSINNAPIIDSYMNALRQLSQLRDESKLVAPAQAPDAYVFQFFSAPTLYKSPLHQQMSIGEVKTTDNQLLRLNYINRIFSNIYVQQPTIIKHTESQLNEMGGIRDVDTKNLHVTASLSEKVNKSGVDLDIDDQVHAEIRKPNFWKYGCNLSAQFQQSHISSNWYKGGEGNYAGNFTVHMNLNYDNQKNIKWDNIFEAQLGFQTTDNDTERKFRPTNNAIRLTTNFGYVAYKQLSYSMQVTANTQMVPNYDRNTTNVIADIFSPIDLYVAPGMKYTIDWGKKIKFTGTVNVAPLAYSFRYVSRLNLATRYGLDPETHTKHTFGPNIEARTKLAIAKNITWDSRIFWFSDYKMTKIEWENTITFKINKYLNSQLYLYPRFEDSSKQYRNESGSYWMFKEWLSLGLSYDLY